MKFRTSLLTGFASGLVVLSGMHGSGQEKATAGATARHVQQERLWATLQKLGEFGKNPEGGVSRVGFTEADLAGRAYVMQLMRDAGLEVRVDPAGNIFGRRAGTESLPVLLFGSHIDSVPHGGNLDGDVGSLGGIEVIRALNQAQIKTRHPLEAASPHRDKAAPDELMFRRHGWRRLLDTLVCVSPPNFLYRIHPKRHIA